MEGGDPEAEYIISSESREVVEVFDLAAETTGIPAPRKVSPLWFIILAKATTPLEWITTPPEGMEPEMFRTYGGTKILVDNSTAERECGIEHRPLEEGLREYLEWEPDRLDEGTELMERTTGDVSAGTGS